MSNGEPEELGTDLQGGDSAIGGQLREFFLELLQGKNLLAYHQNRRDYITGRLGDSRAADLLLSEDVTELERHILAIYGSSRAKPLWVVSPPY